MLEIVVLSGKGGTGKTSLTGAFAALAGEHLVCDLDVDAPDLHLLLQPEPVHEEDFHAGHVALIDQDRCDDCGLCAELCRFGAIGRDAGGPTVRSIDCEGCGVCVHFCPAQAIDFPIRHCGRWYVSETRFGPMVHAQLFPGQENSGLLISLLRRRAKELAAERGLELILADGSPGIGCPVISSLTGADLAVIVTEPTPSGRHDLERVADLADHFHIPAGVVINKADLNPAGSEAIERLATRRGLRILARLPFDPIVTEAMLAGRVITEYRPGGLAELVGRAWDDILALARLKQAA